MRFMMMLPTPVDVLENWQPRKEVVGAMRKFSDDMRKAGVLLSAEGLHPTSRGTRIRVSGGRRTLTDGPFAEAKEVIAGFWMIQVKSKDEAVEWANRCPLGEDGLIEVRQVFEAHDFPPDLQPKSAKA
jgi:hypothetical protein